VDALGSLLESYRPVLMAIANRSVPAQLRSKVGASDLVQQTCEDAFLGIAAVRAQDGNQLWRWLSSLLSRNVCDLHRRFVDCQKRFVGREEVLGRHINLTGDKDIPVVTGLVKNEMGEQLHAAMSRLPLAHREVLRWRFLEEKSCEEIGVMVSRSTDSIRMMINRALIKLEQELPEPSFSR
jgi:RNA polymerase sigma-70 factor (ECF subfamily)